MIERPLPYPQLAPSAFFLSAWHGDLKRFKLLQDSYIAWAETADTPSALSLHFFIRRTHRTEATLSDSDGLLFEWHLLAFRGAFPYLASLYIDYLFAHCKPKAYIQRRIAQYAQSAHNKDMILLRYWRAMTVTRLAVLLKTAQTHLRLVYED